jgi:hypothetical protein
LGCLRATPRGWRSPPGHKDTKTEKRILGFSTRSSVFGFDFQIFIIIDGNKRIAAAITETF